MSGWHSINKVVITINVCISRFFRQDTHVITSEDTKPVYIITHCYMTYLNINHLIPLSEEK